MYPWYDAWWLADYARARAILARERPDLLALFERRLKVFEAPADFVVPRLDGVTLEPGQAALFSGSSQWHYRDRMPPHERRRFCELLFFHFIPAGTRDLVRPSNWARIFGVPQLAGLGGNDDHFI